MLMQPQTAVGIVGYGAYVPRYRLPASEVNRIWHDGEDAMPVLEKSVPGPDEDTVTMSIEAARNALARAGIDPALLGAVWVGTESHPYAVKPTSTIVAEAIGAVPYTLGADWQFACKAGTEALQAAIGLVGSQHGALCPGHRDGHRAGPPGDALEYTAAAGGAAYVLGPAPRAWPSWRAPVPTSATRPTFGGGQDRSIPSTPGASRASRPTFGTCMAAADESAGRRWATGRRFRLCRVPSAQRALSACAPRASWASPRADWAPGCWSTAIGNAYAGSSLLGLSAVLDIAAPGSASCTSPSAPAPAAMPLCWRTTERLPERRHAAPQTIATISRAQRDRLCHLCRAIAGRL